MNSMRGLPVAAQGRRGFAALVSAVAAGVGGGFGGAACGARVSGAAD